MLVFRSVRGIYTPRVYRVDLFAFYLGLAWALPIFYICYERTKGWLNINMDTQYCIIDAFLQ